MLLRKAVKDFPHLATTSVLHFSFHFKYFLFNYSIIQKKKKKTQALSMKHLLISNVKFVTSLLYFKSIYIFYVATIWGFKQQVI